MKNILVLCTGNSCRSQMAHGYLEQLLSDRAKVYSAGVETHGLNPRAVAAMMEDGVDIAHYSSNNVEEYLTVPFDYIITVCDHANERCPYIPGNAERLHYNFPDPAKAEGTEQEIQAQFRATRDLIKTWCEDFAARVCQKSGN